MAEKYTQPRMGRVQAARCPAISNRNRWTLCSFPWDWCSAWYTSGIRVGTPALTSRGLGADEFDQVAELITGVLKNTTPVTASTGKPGKAKYTIADGVAERTHGAADELLGGFPLYPGLEV